MGGGVRSGKGGVMLFVRSHADSMVAPMIQLLPSKEMGLLGCFGLARSSPKYTSSLPLQMLFTVLWSLEKPLRLNVFELVEFDC